MSCGSFKYVYDMVSSWNDNTFDMRLMAPSIYVLNFTKQPTVWVERLNENQILSIQRLIQRKESYEHLLRSGWNQPTQDISNETDLLTRSAWIYSTQTPNNLEKSNEVMQRSALLDLEVSHDLRKDASSSSPEDESEDDNAQQPYKFKCSRRKKFRSAIMSSSSDDLSDENQIKELAHFSSRIVSDGESPDELVDEETFNRTFRKLPADLVVSAITHEARCNDAKLIQGFANESRSSRKEETTASTTPQCKPFPSSNIIQISSPSSVFTKNVKGIKLQHDALGTSRNDIDDEERRQIVATVLQEIVTQIVSENCRDKKPVSEQAIGSFKDPFSSEGVKKYLLEKGNIQASYLCSAAPQVGAALNPKKEAISLSGTEEILLGRKPIQSPVVLGHTVSCTSLVENDSKKITVEANDSGDLSSGKSTAITATELSPSLCSAERFNRHATKLLHHTRGLKFLSHRSSYYRRKRLQLSERLQNQRKVLENQTLLKNHVDDARKGFGWSDIKASQMLSYCVVIIPKNYRVVLSNHKENFSSISLSQEMCRLAAGALFFAGRQVKDHRQNSLQKLATDQNRDSASLVDSNQPGANDDDSTSDYHRTQSSLPRLVQSEQAPGSLGTDTNTTRHGRAIKRNPRYEGFLIGKQALECPVGHSRQQSQKYLIAELDIAKEWEILSQTASSLDKSQSSMSRDGNSLDRASVSSEACPEKTLSHDAFKAEKLTVGAENHSFQAPQTRASISTGRDSDSHFEESIAPISFLAANNEQPASNSLLSEPSENSSNTASHSRKASLFSRDGSVEKIKDFKVLIDPSVENVTVEEVEALNELAHLIYDEARVVSANKLLFDLRRTICIEARNDLQLMRYKCLLRAQNATLRCLPRKKTYSRMSKSTIQTEASLVPVSSVEAKVLEKTITQDSDIILTDTKVRCSKQSSGSAFVSPSCQSIIRQPRVSSALHRTDGLQGVTAKNSTQLRIETLSDPGVVPVSSITPSSASTFTVIKTPVPPNGHESPNDQIDSSGVRSIRFTPSSVVPERGFNQILPKAMIRPSGQLRSTPNIIRKVIRIKRTQDGPLFIPHPGGGVQLVQLERSQVPTVSQADINPVLASSSSQLLGSSHARRFRIASPSSVRFTQPGAQNQAPLTILPVKPVTRYNLQPHLLPVTCLPNLSRFEAASSSLTTARVRLLNPRSAIAAVGSTLSQTTHFNGSPRNLVVLPQHPGVTQKVSAEPPVITLPSGGMLTATSSNIPVGPLVTDPGSQSSLITTTVGSVVISGGRPISTIAPLRMSLGTRASILPSRHTLATQRSGGFTLDTNSGNNVFSNNGQTKMTSLPVSVRVTEFGQALRGTQPVQAQQTRNELSNLSPVYRFKNRVKHIL